MNNQNDGNRRKKEMPVDFGALRKQGSNNMAQLQKTLEKTEKNNYDDPRIWKYARDEKTNESVCVIRFLPIPAVDMEGVEAGTFIAEDLTPVVKVLRHQFKGAGGKWFNFNSPQTFGEEDPVREWSSPKWVDLKKLGEGHPDYERRKKELLNYIPSEDYYANILVISDSVNPENNGKVKLFKFGRAVRKLLDEANEPKFGADPFDPFDAFAGRNLHLKLTFEKRNFSGRESWVPDFKHCEWDSKSTPVSADEAEIEKYWRESHSLLEFLDRKNFPSYADMKKEFCKVMNMDENFNPVSGTQAHNISGAASAPAPSAGASNPNTANTSNSLDAASDTPAANTPAPTTAAASPAAEDDLDSLADLLRD